MDRPLKIGQGVLTRRQFLYLAGGTVTVAAAGPILAACGASGATPSPSAAAATAAPATAAASVGASQAAAVASPTAIACPAKIPLSGSVGGPLALFEWEGYDGKGVPQWDAWYKANSIDLTVKYVTDQSNPSATMRSPAGKDYDVFSFNQGDVLNAWADGDLLTPISIDEVPALAKMYPFFRDNELFHICDNQDVYATVPWQWGPLGLIARADTVPVASLASWQGLLDPKYKGKIITYDDPLNAVSQGACACNLDPANLTREQLNGPVKDFWTQLFPQLKAVVTSAGDQANLLASGDAWISMMGWAYNISQMQSQGVKANFVIPDEGTYGFIDTIAIPPWAKNRRNAIAWANAMMEGDTSVALQESTIGMSTNPEVNAKVSSDVRGLFPADLEKFFSKQLKFNRSWRDPNGPYATMDEWAAFWNAIKTGG
jgi:spermidine/putrescine-binding protein